MNIKIDITVDDPRAIYPILKADVEDGAYFKAETGVSGKAYPLPTRHALPGPEVISFGLQFGAGVSAALIAHWLYDRLGSKGATIVIEKKKIRIENVERLERSIIEAIIKRANKK